MFFRDVARSEGGGELATGAADLPAGAEHPLIGLIAPSKVPPHILFEPRGDDSRSPEEFLRHERESEPYRIVFGADPYADYNEPPKPVQDEVVWAKLDRRFKNACPRNIWGGTCVGYACCKKLRICNYMIDKPHVSTSIPKTSSIR